MNGTITFDSLEDLVTFLKYFVGCTATFQVNKCCNYYVLTFTKGF